MIAHELCILALLVEGRPQENDEELTDLSTIALGLGIFTAHRKRATTKHISHEYKNISIFFEQTFSMKNSFLLTVCVLYSLTVLSQPNKVSLTKDKTLIGKPIEELVDIQRCGFSELTDNVLFANAYYIFRDTEKLYVFFVQSKKENDSYPYHNWKISDAVTINGLTSEQKNMACWYPCSIVGNKGENAIGIIEKEVDGKPVINFGLKFDLDNRKIIRIDSKEIFCKLDDKDLD